MSDAQGNPAAKLWGGRFTEATHILVETYTSSIRFDQRLFRHDILASQVHARMLARQGIIEEQEAEQIVAGLKQVLTEIKAGILVFSVALEDIHMNVESRLREIIGPLAGKLHTARSRNDQVATDIRLYLRDEVDELTGSITRLQRALLTLAQGHSETWMPGFTHLQNAQAVSFAHHLLAYFEMLERDHGRLLDLRKRLNQCPLGAAALAGSPYPIDREWVAQELGFDGICRNSLDAVSDRDFAIELVAASALIMTHLSRFSEELILWMTPAFGFIALSDAYCTGSSIMPQKKNPDVPELVRGKTGRVNGALVSLLTLMKGLPLAYNKDMQEDKEPVFDTVDTVRDTLAIFTGMVSHIQVKPEAMAKAAGQGFTTATDVADYLVRQKGVPFREAHEIVGRLVHFCDVAGKTLPELTVEEMAVVHPLLDAGVLQVVPVAASAGARKALGGTAPETVRAALAEAARRIEERSR